MNVWVYIHVFLQAFVTLFPKLQLNVDLQMSGNITSGLVLWTWESLDIPQSRGMLADVAWGFQDLRTSFRSCCAGLKMLQVSLLEAGCLARNNHSSDGRHISHHSEAR